MQSILYHNSSGSLAFTGNLKKREVHQAITMHPVKDHHHMYRIHSYLKNLRIQELKETIISLHRDILIAASELKMQPYELATYNVAMDVPLFPNMQGHSGYLGDTNILGVAPNLNRYHPNKLESVLSWDFISKAVFSPDNSNPKRRMEFSMKEGLDDIIRELMENINAFSKQRGRVIEFREILYGYQRLDPIHGADYILDILLVYKKYRGRKMTVPVRRHAYLQQSFTGLEIHEVTIGDNRSLKSATKYENSEQIDYDTDNIYPGGESGASTPGNTFINFKKLNVPIREVFETGMLKISEKLPYVFRSQPSKEDPNLSVQIINFILPLSGRFDIFLRFMKNYEEVCLIGDKRTSLIITLYNDNNNPSDFNRTLDLINSFSKKYPYTKIVPIKITDSQFSRALALEKGVEVCNREDLLFLIDVDILFNAESLQRVRLNTVRSHQAYFPIVFSEYDPGVVNGDEYNIIKINNRLAYKESIDSGDVVGDHVHMKAQSENGNKYYTKPDMLSDDRGYFRQFGFGIASVYKSDFVIVGGFNTDIKGWGLEDVHLYDKFVQSNVSIFRSVDAGLVHVFHPVDCDKNLELAQYNMCIGTRANTFGSIKHMILYLFNHPKIVNVIQTVSVDDKPRIVP